MKKDYLIPILIFISFAIVVYLIIPTFGRLKNLREDVVQTERNLQLAKDYLSNVQKTSVDLKDYQEVFQIIDVAMPYEADLASVMSFLQIEASRNGLVVGDMGIGKFSYKKTRGVKEISEPREVSINLNLTGPLVSFENFLMLIEQSSRFFEVVRLLYKGTRRNQKRSSSV